VEYAIAWTDAFRARVKLGSRLPVYLDLDTHWKSVSLTHSVEFTVREVDAAEFYLASVLE